MKRMLCLLMTLCLVLTLMPTAVSAASAIRIDPVIHQNPLYEGIVLPAVQPRTVQPRAASEEYYATTQEAGVALRQAMKQRQTACDINLTIPDYTQQKMENALYEMFDIAVTHTGAPTEGDYLMWQYATWGAGAEGYLDGTTAYLTYSYEFQFYTDAAQEAQVDSAIASLRSQLQLSGKSDYDKVAAIYDYICANVTYDREHLEDQSYTLQYTAYAALIQGTSVCQGYALLLYRLALEEGIDCRLIPGVAAGGAHGWNIIRLDGLYYNLDSTWDSGNAEYSCFLRGSGHFPNHTRDAEYDTAQFHAAYPMSSEDYGAHIHSYTSVTTQPSCHEAGKTVYTCTGCGYSYTDTIPATGHSFGGWTNVTAATCTKDGAQQRTCTRCNMSETRTVSATGHSFSQWTATDAASCTESGIEKRTCGNCGLTEERATTAPGHSFGGWTQIQTPTCTQDGLQERTCTRCGTSETRTVAATGHALSQWTITRNATCTEDGEQKRTCANCTYSECQTIAALGHNYQDKVCQRCGDRLIGTVSAPAAPEIKSCYSKAQTSVKVTWTPVSGADGYELWRSTTPNDANSWTRAKSILNGSTDRYTNQGLTIGVTYYYKVRAFVLDENGQRICSQFSDMSYMPAAVVFDNPYSNSTSRIRLLWNEISGAHGYQIWQQDENGSWKIVKTLGDKGNTLTNNQGATTAYSNTGLIAGGKYTYRMRAFMITADGRKVFGAYSDSFTVAVKPNAPTVSVTCPKAGRAKISWTPVNGAAGYQIWMSTSPNGGFQIVKSVTDGSTAYTKTGLQSGKTYYFKVRAYAEVNGRKTFSPDSKIIAITIP